MNKNKDLHICMQIRWLNKLADFSEFTDECITVESHYIYIYIYIYVFEIIAIYEIEGNLPCTVFL